MGGDATEVGGGGGVFVGDSVRPGVKSDRYFVPLMQVGSPPPRGLEP
jgi:hypothetical protein